MTLFDPNVTFRCICVIGCPIKGQYHWRKQRLFQQCLCHIIGSDKKKWKNKKSDMALIIWIRDEKKSNWFLKLLHIITTVCIMVVGKHITKISVSAIPYCIWKLYCLFNVLIYLCLPYHVVWKLKTMRTQ